MSMINMMMNKMNWRSMRNFFMGFGSSIEIAPVRGYIRPSQEGFRRDQTALRKDHAKVGGDVRNAIKVVNG